MSTSNYKLFRFLGLNVIEDNQYINELTQKFYQYSESITDYLQLLKNTTLPNKIVIESQIFELKHVHPLETQLKIEKYLEEKMNNRGLISYQNEQAMVASLVRIDYEKYFIRFNDKPFPVLVLGNLSNEADIPDCGNIECFIIEFKPIIKKKKMFHKEKKYIQIRILKHFGNFCTKTMRKCVFFDEYLTSSSELTDTSDISL